MRRELSLCFILILALMLSGCVSTEGILPAGTGGKIIQGAPVAVKTVLKIEEAEVCLNVVDRVPIGAGKRFDMNAGRLFFFTKIAGAQRPIDIEHVWFWNGKEAARIPIKVNSSRWRASSAKKIEVSQVGRWSVKVYDTDGREMICREFEIY